MTGASIISEPVHRKTVILTNSHFDFATTVAVFSSTSKVRALIIDNVSQNIKKCPRKTETNF